MQPYQRDMHNQADFLRPLSSELLIADAIPRKDFRSISISMSESASGEHTLWPACTHSDSLSTASLLLIILSNIRVNVTSSSEGLRKRKSLR